jgi:hypothetical protein
MKKLITLIILMICLYDAQAQFLQSVNKKAEIDTKSSTKNTDKEYINASSNIRNQKELLGFDGKISPFAAGIFIKDCDKKLKQLNEQLSSEENANSNFKEKNNNIIKITANIKLWKELKEDLKTLNSLGGNPKFSRKFVPLRSIQQAKYFYFTDTLNQKNIKLVSDLVAQSSFDGTISLSSNVFTGILPIEHLPIKINLSTTVSQTKDSTATDKASAKLPYGGLVNINLSYPLFYSSKEKDKGKYTTFYMPFELKYHLDDVKDKAQFKDTYHYFEASTSLYISADLIQQDNKESITIFANPNLAYYYGGGVFKQKIGYNSFWISQLNIGIKLAKQFTLGANIPLYSSQKEIKDKQNASLALIFEPK